MSYRVIARKYRPQIFDEVVGQPLVSETLKNAILTDRVAHGYIFSGARGVGKTTMARILAKSLNCRQGPTITPCGECPSCLEIAAGNSVDVLEIDAASNRGIDEIRQLRENVRYLPARDRYKVFIIDEVHMLTTEAFNALLKTLEEPPERSLFILATTEAHKLPATIQSRCQHFAFRLLDYSEILGRLGEICASEGVEAAQGGLSVIAGAAEGSLRDALSLLDEVIAASGKKIDEETTRQLLGVVPSQLLRELIEAIDAGDSRAVLEGVSELGTRGYDLSALCTELIRYVRNLMIAKSCGAGSRLLQAPESDRAELGRVSALFSEEDLSRFFQMLLRAQHEMRYSLQPRFHLELALIKLVHARKLVSIERLLSGLRSLVPGTSSRQGAPETALKSSEARDALPATSVTGQGLPAAQPSKPAQIEEPYRAAEGQAVREIRAASPGPGNGPAASAAPESPPDPSSGLSPSTGDGPAEAPPPVPGVEDASLAAIKAALFEESKFLSSCLNPLAGWRFENGQVHLLYSKQGSWAAELLQSHQHQEKLRAACEKVLGQPVRIRVTLDAESGRPSPMPATLSAQERAQRNPAVEAFRKRFDCIVLEVKDLRRE
jgi:DNA polymerase III subunit gamma/tau